MLACALNPAMLNSKEVHEDVKKRAKWYLDNIVSVGSYTHTMGAAIVRESVAKYIAKNDQVPKPSIDQIFLTEGAGQGAQLLIQMLMCSQSDGIMIPIPQYPLYSAAITLAGAQSIPYYLDEESGWQLKFEELLESYNQAVKKGTRVRAIVVINPGNPTGAIFREETIRNIIRFSVEKKLVLIADEVYRDNIYKEGVKFLSFRAVL